MWERVKTALRLWLEAKIAKLALAAAIANGKVAAEDRIDSVARQLLLARISTGPDLTENEIRECVRLAAAYDAELHQPTERPGFITSRYSEMERGES